ncbi:MAG: efflux RND transporter periplasmic adaptor subunit [Acidobacteriota bacterium]
MDRKEKFGWTLVSLLAVTVVVAASIRYQEALLRLAGHAPLAGAYVQRWFPEAFGFTAMPEHEHEGLIDYWTCSMHPSVHLTEAGTCPICSMDLVPVYKPGEEPPGEATIEAADAEPVTSAEQRATFRIDPTWQQAIAVTMVPVTRRRLSETFRTVGRISYDENRLVDVNIKLSGWIQRLYVAETGQLVGAGQPLFELYSPELVSTQREYFLALENLERVGASPEPEIIERARSLVAAARRRLLLWDLATEQVDRLASSGEVADALPIVSPATGYVVEKMAVQGMHVTPGTRLYRIANLDKVWVLADVYESELPFVKTGQSAVVRLPYDPDRSWRARIDYLYPTLEPRTRTVKIRLVVDNPELNLRPDMYADVVLKKETGLMLAVPREAVLDLGTRHIVFVNLGDGRLQAREVAVGKEVGDFILIRAGLEEGESIVGAGHFLVDAESKVRGVVPLPVAPRPDGRRRADGPKQEFSR